MIETDKSDKHCHAYGCECLHRKNKVTCKTHAAQEPGYEDHYDDGGAASSSRKAAAGTERIYFCRCRFCQGHRKEKDEPPDDDSNDAGKGAQDAQVESGPVGLNEWQ